MGFEKGREKTGGRRPGVKNKTTAEIRDAILKVVSNQVDSLERDLLIMPEFKRWTIISSLAKYGLPALAKNENDTTVSGDINISVSFTDEAPTCLSPEDTDPF